LLTGAVPLAPSGNSFPHFLQKAYYWEHILGYIFLLTLPPTLSPLRGRGWGGMKRGSTLIANYLLLPLIS
jgi:hypothetical protein